MHWHMHWHMVWALAVEFLWSTLLYVWCMYVYFVVWCIFCCIYIPYIICTRPDNSKWRRYVSAAPAVQLLWKWLQIFCVLQCISVLIVWYYNVQYCNISVLNYQIKFTNQVYNLIFTSTLKEYHLMMKYDDEIWWKGTEVVVRGLFSMP